MSELLICAASLGAHALLFVGVLIGEKRGWWRSPGA